MTCKYILTSGSTAALDISINTFQNPSTQGARLRIYGGIDGNNIIVFDSNLVVGDAWRGIVYTAPCGKSTVILESNDSLVNYGLDLGYQLNPLDIQGNACIRYIASLEPKVIKADPNIVYYYIGGAAAVFIILSVALYFAWKHFPHHLFKRYYKIHENEFSMVTVHHPRYICSFFIVSVVFFFT
jgi:hypothetical protein